jgi:hypothetical protein
VKSLCDSLRQNEGNAPATLTEEHELIRPLAEYQTHFNQRMN